MAIKLGDAIVFISGDRTQLNKDLDSSERETKTWTVAVGTTIGNLMGNVITGGVNLAINGVKALGSELVGMAMDAVNIEGVQNTFANLVETVGGDAVVAMDALRVATRGMVADADLMEAGNKFLAMGIAGTAEQAAELAEVATQLGSAMGEDATASMENFALMMANQSIPRLDSFGISSGKVRERIDELMASTEGMTREAAFNQAVMEQARLTMEKVGEQGDTAKAAMDRMSATFSNVGLAIGEGLLTLAEPLLNWLSNLAETWGPKVIAWMEEMEPAITLIADAFGALLEGDIPGFFGSLSEALLALGVSEETVESLMYVLQALWEAFQALIDGDIELFIGLVKAALLELGVPIETIDKLEKAFRTVFEWVEENVPKILGAVEVAWEDVLKPALEGLWKMLNDLKGLFLIVGIALLVGFVAPMVLAALPVIALGAALIALGLIWGQFGDQVMEVLRQLNVIMGAVFSNAIGWVITFLETLAGIQWPDWLQIPGEFGKGFRDSLENIKASVDEFNRENVESMAALPPPEQRFDPQAGFQNLLGGLGLGQTTTTTNYNLDVQYQQLQGEGSLLEDIRALQIGTQAP